jgi:hypothetical protein
MSTDVERQIDERVQTFVGELTDLVRQAALEAVSEAFGGGIRVRRGGRRSASGGRAPGRRAKGAKRARAEIEALTGRLLSAIKKAPGQGLQLIGKALDVPSKELRFPIRKLLTDKSIRKTGHKRNTRYFAK